MVRKIFTLQFRFDIFLFFFCFLFFGVFFGCKKNKKQKTKNTSMAGAGCNVRLVFRGSPQDRQQCLHECFFGGMGVHLDHVTMNEVLAQQDPISRFMAIITRIRAAVTAAYDGVKVPIFSSWGDINVSIMGHCIVHYLQTLMYSPPPVHDGPFGLFSPGIANDYPDDLIIYVSSPHPAPPTCGVTVAPAFAPPAPPTCRVTVATVAPAGGDDEKHACFAELVDGTFADVDAHVLATKHSPLERFVWCKGRVLDAIKRRSETLVGFPGIKAALTRLLAAGETPILEFAPTASPSDIIDGKGKYGDFAFSGHPPKGMTVFAMVRG